MTSINMLRHTTTVAAKPLFEKGELFRVALAWLMTMTVLAGVLAVLA